MKAALAGHYAGGDAGGDLADIEMLERVREEWYNEAAV